MKFKRKFICLIISLLFFFSFSIKANSAFAAIESTIYLGGIPAGFSIQTRGAYIIGISDVISKQGLISPAKNAGLEIGDIILKIDDMEINCVEDIEKIVNSDHILKISYSRNGEELETTLCPAKDTANKFRLGVFIRDRVNGIGTVTYLDKNKIVSLGHPILSSDGQRIEISGGDIYECNITGYIKGERGKPGELKGYFLKNVNFATIDKNLDSGVYGTITNENIYKDLTKIEVGTARPGKATIFTTIDGQKPIEYAISIIKTDYLTRSKKNFVIKIDDERLLETTGGIVQGMSGSPIVQNGKLVGAVTHVFINDPTRGFGISIDNMINNQ